MRKLLMSAVAVTVLMATQGFATEGKFSGIAFGDAYWFAGNHDSAVEKSNGTWMRRVYLTYDVKHSDEVSMRFRLETGSPGVTAGGGKMEPFAKDAYLKWKKGGKSIYFGLSGSPSFAGIEEAWGYRHVEKTPADLYKMASTRDFGIGVKGNLSDQLDYHLMVGNGNATAAENNKGKKYMASVGYGLTDGISIRGNFDFDDQKGEATFTTAQVHLSSKGDGLRWGLHFLANTTDDGNNSESTNVASVYGVKSLSETSSVLARVDLVLDELQVAGGGGYLPMAAGSKLNFILLGYDWTASDGLHLIPNVEIVMYDADGLDTDLVPRITAAFQW